MHLEGLARGGAKRSVAVAIGEIIQGNKQVGGNASTWVAQPQHHLPAADLVGFAQLAMVLLVAAVELQQLNRVFTEADLFVAKFREQRFAQMAAVELAFFCF